MDPATAIRVRGVSKRFRVQRQNPSTSLKSYVLRDLWRRSSRRPSIHWALRKVDLEVPKGTTLGIVGRNGSGKSTLLRVLSRSLRPDEGNVSVNGRVAALIELGLGFHPELTGRENAMINGIILGLSKREVLSKMESIVDFAEIGERIDDPLRTYSTGMALRLGFSVATTVDPDVLLLDELFAVGDLAFSHRCLERMNEFKRLGRTILIVSHDLALVRAWCDEVVWLEGGSVRGRGDPADVVDFYLSDSA